MCFYKAYCYILNEISHNFHSFFKGFHISLATPKSVLLPENWMLTVYVSFLGLLFENNYFLKSKLTNYHFKKKEGFFYFKCAI